MIKFFEPYNVNIEFVELPLYDDEVDTIAGKIRRQLARIRTELTMYRHLVKYDPENSVIHIDEAPWQSSLLLFLLTLRTHVFCTLHNAVSTQITWWRALNWRLRLGFLMKRRRFHLFAANENAIDSMSSYLKKEERDKIDLTRATINPLEIEEVLSKPFDRIAFRKRHGLSPDKFLVMCIGQFIDRKGRWVFLEAAKDLLTKGEDILFVWITPESPTPKELQKIEEYGLDDNFRLILSEHIGETRKDVLTFFRAADAYALPSLWEGLPISILESMALSLPTISTNINGIPEAIKDMDTGILIEVGDVRAMVDAILKLRDEPDLSAKLARDGRKYILEHFDERETARIVLDAYEACFADGR